MIGKTLNQYRITAKLGEGGMGRVYLAQDTRLKRQVALKVLPPQMAKDPERRARFEREAQAVAALNHPNIVTVHSVEEADGIFFITMEHVEGQTLTERIAPGGMPLRDLFEIAIPLADAIAAAHERGVTHRDLKPDNVMVTRDGRIKVLDFGLAKLAHDDTTAESIAALPTATVTAEGKIIGTVNYMSPEQAEGKPVDARTDVFALGILLYEMATGRRPFVGDTPISTISSIMKETPVSLTTLKATLPRHLDRIVRRCLNKDAERRYQSAKELRNELEQFRADLDGGESHAARSAATQPARVTRYESPKIVERPAWALPVVGLLIVGIIAAFVIFVVTREDDSSSVSQSAGSDPTRRIAVLPFENQGQAEDELFADGVTEEITTRLGSVRDLAVISSKSALQYAGSAKTTAEIGKELNVDYLLQGTVRWAHDGDGEKQRVRITPKLIRVLDDTQVWADTFDETIDDVFDVQTRIAGSVSAQLGLALGGASDESGIGTPTTSNVAAWQAYLRGRAYNDLQSPDKIELGIEMFERAVTLDPDFIDAWVELSKAHSVLMHQGADLSAERDEAALETARTALRLDPDSPRARMALGYYHYWGHKDYAPAMKEFSEVLRMLPNDDEALSARGFIRRRQGDWRGALVDLERAAELNPLDFRSNFEVGLTLHALGEYDAAWPWMQRSLEIRPDYVSPIIWRVRGLWCKNGDLEASRKLLEDAHGNDDGIRLERYYLKLYSGDYQGAIEVLDSAASRSFNRAPLSVPGVLFSGWARGLAGDAAGATRDLDSAVAALEPIVESDPDDFSALTPLGVAYALLGRDDEALRAGRRAASLYGFERDQFFGLNVEIWVAWIEAESGEKQAALDRLERILGVPNPYLSPALVKIDPRWKALHGEARFKKLVAG